MRYKNTIQPIKKIVLDPYFVSTILFALWMLFFDDQNVFEQCRLYRRWQKLQTDVVDYTVQIQQIKKDKKELVHNIDFLEQLAREKYYMKREKEDVYVIVGK
ncbi:MAG: septum formation initiator family protein [Candidatus Cardinium sp.]|uniref:FtsB family cell division protein n=1 Tax=Cardinium endosymbiont of Dermatophagoides farinae TaxID=2597823 RepID=UPI00118361FF|nr:septum formation initiator family protein [Cardinium endosymbiont of Dermatophagoides farinae]TSJ80572.1 septum formation initiator family protein [Cardinium endosymbiont of Dermatophagoides farinae]UWW96561.1 MAG: septum formation initiator family protein [Candidatus Cardinium sp.]